jgi:DMSO reductase anchor subunit
MPEILLPARPQVLWKLPAVANFTLGGVGAGLYVIAVMVDGFGASPSARLAAWLGPALVAIGFAAVATEAGRPLRGMFVLRRVRTSWMSREMWLGNAFIALAVLDLVVPATPLRLLAAVAATGFAVAQGYILRAARGVTAWNVSLMPAVFVASAALSGSGSYVLLQTLTGQPAASTLGIALPLLPVGLIVWLRYLDGGNGAAFTAAIAPLRSGRAGRAVLALGYVLPLLGWLAAVAAPAEPATLPVVVSAAMIVAGQAVAKWLLLRKVAVLRPITFALAGAHPHPGRRS